MASRAELKKLSDAVATIKSITAVYEQAAARRMKTVKVEMQNISKYVDSAIGTYSDVKHSVTRDLDEGIKKIILTSSFRKSAKGTVLVLIASATQYYGQLIPRLFRLFLDEYRRTKADGIILGRTGFELLKKEKITASNVTVFDFDDLAPNWEVVHKVSNLVGTYSKIIVFYGEYKSVFTQEVKKGDISEMVVVRDVAQTKEFLFKPGPDVSLTFLENQMIASGFLQKIYESQIAKYAARIKILEIGQVAEKISSVTGDLSRSRRRFRKALNNKKQQQLFTGSNLWGERS